VGLQETEISGLKAWGADPDATECFAMLVFRGGLADETLTTSGRTHLAEHLAMFGIGRTRYSRNAYVADRRCAFHATGTPEEVGSFLTAIAAALHTLPLDRFDDELNVLRLEEAHVGVSFHDHLMRFRFGPRGPGLSWYRAFGLDTVRPDELQAFAAERFVAENAALWFSGPAPVGVEIDLPRGRRLPPPTADPIGRLELPAYVESGTGGVAVASLPPRSIAMSFTLEIARRRAHDRLREELGAAYGVNAEYFAVDSRRAHTLLVADCLDEQAARSRDTLLDVIERLAADGFTPEEHADHLRGAQQWADRAEWTSDADAAVDDELLEESSPSRAEIVAGIESLTDETVTEAARALAENAIVVVPEGVAMPKGGRLRRWGSWTIPPITGERFARARVRLQRPDGTIELGDDGLTLREDGEQSTARFAEVVIVLRMPRDALDLIAADLGDLRVDPALWDGGERLIAAVEERVAPELFVTSPLLARTEAVEEAVQAMQHQRLVGVETAALPELLLDGEELALVERAEVALKVGLLALTSVRLLFLYGDGDDMDVREVPLARVERAEAEKDQLRLQTDEEELRYKLPEERIALFERHIAEHVAATARAPGALF